MGVSNRSCSLDIENSYIEVYNAESNCGIDIIGSSGDSALVSTTSIVVEGSGDSNTGIGITHHISPRIEDTSITGSGATNNYGIKSINYNPSMVTIPRIYRSSVEVLTPGSAHYGIWSDSSSATASDCAVVSYSDIYSVGNAVQMTNSSHIKI